jgi:hypothetical protein
MVNETIIFYRKPIAYVISVLLFLYNESSHCKRSGVLYGQSGKQFFTTTY